MLRDGRVVALGGIIDRVDQKGSIVRVVDYKTSVFKPNIGTVSALFDPTNLRNNTGLQALWYAWLYAKNNPQLAVSIQPTIISTRHLFMPSPPMRLWMLSKDRKSTPIQHIGHHGAAFEEQLDKVLVELFDSTAFFDQTTFWGHCRQCLYKTICQRNQ